MNAEDNVIVATQLEEQVDEKQENASVIDFKMVTFSLGGKDYSIDIMHVKEIAKAGRFTYVPNTLPFVLGVYNLRGEIIPILDLRLFFNVDIEPRKENKLENMLILSIDDQKFGVVVDKIDKVIGVQKSTIQPPHPLFGDINIKYIEGVVESNNRLYVLLDVTRIFSNKEGLDANEMSTITYTAPKPVAKPAEKSEPKQEAPKALNADAAFASGTVKSPADIARSITGVADAEPVEEISPVESGESVESEKTDVDLKFVKESLQNYSGFYVTSVNESWVQHRFNEWTKEKGLAGSQLQSKEDSEEFLKSFWSSCNGTWWTREFAESVSNLLPENSAKQIILWNPGCGKGIEAYSLACLMKEKYPDAKLRIYAQDIDLLNVSNASLLSVPTQLADDWYGPYLTKKANGDYTFSKDITDSIMFEYHDCKNTNALPMVDVIFARDILSLFDESAQETVVADFLEKMKGNGILVLGENETVPSSFNFGENTVGTLVAYTKD